MSYPVKPELLVLAVILVCIAIFCCNSGNAEKEVPCQTGVAGGEHDVPHQTGVAGGEEDVPRQTGVAGGEEDVPYQTGVAGGDPAEIVAKALLCFNDKHIYSSCEESYRLTESGNLNVPPDYTEQFCDGPCLTETHLVLNCIENILKHFEFHNRATLQDVRDTVEAGCGHGLERGNFNVAEHIEAEENKAHKVVNRILFGFGLIIAVRGLLLG